MLTKIILACVAAVVAFLICVFVGGLLATTGVPIAVFVGGFLKEWATLISILVFIWYFFGGTSFTNPFTRA
jgi:hypothetical protein